MTHRIKETHKTLVGFQICSGFRSVAGGSASFRHREFLVRQRADKAKQRRLALTPRVGMTLMTTQSKSTERLASSLIHFAATDGRHGPRDFQGNFYIY